MNIKLQCSWSRLDPMENVFLLLLFCFSKQLTQVLAAISDMAYVDCCSNVSMLFSLPNVIQLSPACVLHGGQSEA